MTMIALNTLSSLKIICSKDMLESAPHKISSFETALRKVRIVLIAIDMCNRQTNDPVMRENMSKTYWESEMLGMDGDIIK